MLAIIRMTDGRSQVSPCYDLTDNALVEESSRHAREYLVPYGANFDRRQLPEHPVLLYPEGYYLEGRRYTS